MSNNKNLLQELLDKKNLYLNEDSTFNLTKIYTSYLFTIIIFSLILGLLITVLEQFFFINNYFSFNDYASLVIGYSSLFYSIKLIKEKVITYYSTNPIILTGIIYPCFFNSSIFEYLDLRFLHTNMLGIIFGLLSILINYLILNYFYHKHY